MEVSRVSSAAWRRAMSGSASATTTSALRTTSVRAPSRTLGRYIAGIPPTTLIFAVVLVAGSVLRLHVIGTEAGRLNADDTVTYLQALRAGHGHLDAFFWGQSYGGSILPWTSGVIMRLTSANEAEYQILGALWWLGVALIYRALCTRLWDRAAGDLMGIVVWVGTSFSTIFSVTEPDFYGPVVALGGAALLVATTSGPLGALRGTGLGLVCGLAVWTVPIGLAFALPALFLVFLRRPSMRAVWAIVGGTVVGGSPWLLFNLRNHFASLKQPHEPLRSVPHRLHLVVTDLVPWALPGSPHHAIRVLFGIAFLGCLLVGGGLALLHRRPDRCALAVSGILATLIVSDTKVPIGQQSVRYAMFLLPAAAAFACAAVTRLRTGQLVACVLGVMLYATTTHTLLTSPSARSRVDGFGPPPGGPWGDLRALERYLDAHGETRVWANYWTSYPLTADTRLRIIAAPLAPQRFLPYTEAAHAAPNTVVVMPGRTDDLILTRARHLPPHRRTVVGGFVVYEFTGRVADKMLPAATF